MACLCESCGNITFCLDDSLTQIKILVCVNQALDSYIYENRVYENMFLRLDFFICSCQMKVLRQCLFLSDVPVNVLGGINFFLLFLRFIFLSVSSLF